jgi:hypothetical protein
MPEPRPASARDVVGDVGPDEQHLLGLVTAVGGGLTALDLAELSGLPEYDVEENLHAVAGRAFATRAGSWRPVRPCTC